MLRKNIAIAILYNLIIVAFFVMIETEDPTGQGLIGLPMCSVPLTMVHCGVILALFFKTRKKPFRFYLGTMFVIGGVNFVMLFVDLILILLGLNLLHWRGSI